MVAAKQRSYPAEFHIVERRVKLCRVCHGAGWVLDFPEPASTEPGSSIALALVPCPDDGCEVAGTPILTLDVHQGGFDHASKVEGVVASVMRVPVFHRGAPSRDESG